uniref:CCHC-type domain-containing protein n=1 Tax=Sipha flava TaxID=143950 RepID=A0A2S2QYA6_9HEMI
MSASSSVGGGNPPHGQNQSTGKTKKLNARLHNTDHDWSIATNKKASHRNKVPTPNSPIPPTLQQIYNNQPVLNMPSQTFKYDNTLSNSLNESSSVHMNIDSSTTDHTTASVTDNTTNTAIISRTNITDNHAIIIDSTLIADKSSTYSIDNQLTFSNDNIKSRLRLFSHDYAGPVITLVECVDPGKNLGNWHPLKASKFFSSNFEGITNIKPTSLNKIKITFNSVFNGNICLNSNILSNNGFTAIIPSTLIYSFGIIKLDNTFSEDDFPDGLQSSMPVEAFKRISIKKDGIIIQTRIVELKFLSPKIPSHISIYNMLFDVQPSIRSPVQCNRCLRFGHTQKFCRSKPRCSHCGSDDHSFDACPSAHTTNLNCIFCNLPHLATDHSCREWLFLKEIKKIMATENLSYREALDFKKNKFHTSAFKYSDIVNSQSIPAVNTSVPTSFTTDDFPNLNPSHHFFNSRKKKIKSHPSSHQNHFSIPHESLSPLPNGSYLNTYDQNSQPLKQSPNDFSWVHPLSLKLSESLINSPSLLTPFTSTTSELN